MKIEFRKLAAVLLLAVMSLSTSAMAWDRDDCGDCNPCDSYDSCLCSGFFVIYENVIVKPYFSSNYAYYIENPDGLNGQTAVMFDWDYEYTPRIELGWINDCGVGLRARYWRFDGDTSESAFSAGGDIYSHFADDSISPTIGVDGVDNASFKHSLEMDVVDVEFLFQRCCWIYSAGARYTGMDQKYAGVETNVASTTDALAAKHDFCGGGLTTAVEYFQPCWCGFSLFTKARGSLLYGDSKFKAVNPNDPGSIISSKNENDIMAVGELQLGIDWHGYVCNVCSFVRFAIETQYWLGAGSGGPGDNAVFDEGNYQNSNPLDANLGFFGFNIALGLQF